MIIVEQWRQLKKLGPVHFGDKYEGDICFGCGGPIIFGEFYALVPIGPGADSEARRRCREMRGYEAVIIPMHWACATGEE